MKTSTRGMQTAHPELHVAQRKMRAALQDAVARGRSKPEMEVCDLLAAESMHLFNLMSDDAACAMRPDRCMLPPGEACQASWRGPHPTAQRQLCYQRQQYVCSPQPCRQACAYRCRIDRLLHACLLIPLGLQHCLNAVPRKDVLLG